MARPAPRRRVRTPTLLQMEEVECGAAALGIVLGYYGRNVPLEELRVACGVSRDGSKASNIVRAARAYGLQAAGLRLEPEALPAQTLPCIVFWGFNHFQVVEGFGRHTVYLNDPATGPRVVTDREFDELFTGVVLTFAPGPGFAPGGTRPSLTGLLRRRLRGSWGALLYCVLAGLILAVPGLVVPALAKVFVDDVLVQQTAGWAGPVLVGLAVAALLTAVVSWLQRAYLLRLSTKLSVSTSGAFLWHVLRLPAEFYAQRFSGEIGWRVQLNDAVAQLLSGQLATTVLSGITVVVYVAVMFSYDVVLTLLGVAFAVLNLVALRYVSQRRVDLNRRLVQEVGKQVGMAMNGLQGIETIKATGAEADFFARWAGAQAKVVNVRQDLAVPTQFLTAVPPLLALLSTTAILAVGGLRVMQGELTVGSLVAFQILMAGFTRPFGDFVALGSSLQEARGNIDRLEDVLHSPLDPLAPPDSDASGAGVAPAGVAPAGVAPAGVAGRLSGRLELRGVTFGYSRLDPPLIDGLDLTVAPGQRVALVGSTGSGKSTIARLVCGLEQPWSGEILFDGRPRVEVPRPVMAASLALVDQQICLFEGTVSENLTLWDDSIPEDRVVQAARDAAIHDDVAARAGGYASRVEDGGRNLSGGQRQRLEIARALVGDPGLLVLDEATSALDPLTEQQVDASLRRRGCACLIVAHRLSTIRDCDEILVLDGGKVVQRGTHDALKGVPGPYAMLIAG